MVVINACGGALNPLLAMTAVIEARREREFPVEARSNHAQRLMWRNAAIAVNACIFDPEQFPDLRDKQTLAGLPFLLDESLPVGVIELRDRDNKVVARIENLAIPIHFPVSTPAGSRSQPAPTTRALPTQDAVPHQPEKLG